MNAVAWLLTNGANALLWVWEVALNLLGGVFGALHVFVNRPFSWFLALVNPACTKIGDLVFGLLAWMPLWAGLVVISLAAGAAMLLVFRYASNQEAIGRIKDEMKADLLALKLYKDAIRVTFLSQLRLIRSAARLQWYMLGPLMIMLVPMCLGLAQMGIRYQWRPLLTGETAIITMVLDDEVDPLTVALDVCPGVMVEAGPVPASVEGRRELTWRVRGAAPGRYRLAFHVAGKIEEKELVVGGGFSRVSAERPGYVWTARLLHPAEPPVDRSSPVNSIAIGYPGRESMVYGADWWIVTFFIVSIVGALVLKPVFKVRL